jgi:hypothetical protein
MTLEEFANKKSLSVRAKHVLLNISKEGLYCSKEELYIEVKPTLRANIFDVFKYVNPEALIRFPNCGKKTRDEIVKALEEEQFLNWSNYENT